MMLRPRARHPDTVDAYELLEKIAEGGMGTVYRGRRKGTGEAVAVKLLPPEKGGGSLRLKRFEQEFRAALRLDHPNIVRVLDFGCVDDMHYLVMELVDGPSLGDKIEQDGRLGEAEAVDVAIQAATGLHYAHQSGLIHRDVKPDNILLARGGLAKLADLGLVKMLDRDIDLTQPGSGLGTPNFMAPEQFNDAKHADPRCDVYSLGATLYMAVTGNLPFQASTPLGVLKKKTRAELPPPRSVVPALSERTERVILRAMNLEPRMRPGSCQEFIGELTGRSAPRPAARGRSGVRRAVPKSFCGQERRTSLRFASTQEGCCLALAGDKDHEWTARVQDISHRGIGLVINRRFESGSVLLVQLHDRDRGFPHYLMVRVVRHQVLAPRKWLHGCTFARSLSEDELKVLL